MGEPTTALVKRDAGTSIGKRARGKFDPGQMELIRATVASDCNEAELGMFLELCARYELDPFARQIWAVKMKGRLTIIVARDGLLAIADRSGEFIGMEGDVVRENDDFRKVSGNAMPEHSYGAKDRGTIVGAWATVFREGRKPTYFFAPFEEYMPSGRNLTDYSPWKYQTSAMILKCAEAMALRKGFTISGLVAEEEMGNQRLVNGAAAEVEDEVETEWGDDASLASWLEALFAAVNAERPGAWMPAKIRMTLRGKSHEEREVIASQLVDNLVKVGARVPEREVIQDAEVVDPEDSGYVPSDPDEDIPFGAEEMAPADQPLDGQETLEGLDGGAEG